MSVSDENKYWGFWLVYLAPAFLTAGMWLDAARSFAPILAFLWPATWLTYLGWWLVN